MSESRRILAILVYDTGAAPSTTDFGDVIRNQRYSLARYWQDNAFGVVSIDRFDLAGPYLVSLPAFTFDSTGQPVSPSRTTTVDAARTAAQQAGVDLSPYDATFVVLSPGYQVVGGVNLPYDGGTDSTGTKSLVMITDSLTIFEHEMGHVLGFDHTQGAVTGTNNTGTPVWDYGDPYDIMSAELFGGTNPMMTATGTPTSYPASATVGPMLSRGELYRAKKDFMEPLGTVVHRKEGGNTSVRIYQAGTGTPDRPELLVYTTAQGGEIYVELRAPGPESARNWWDTGLQDPSEGGTGNVPAALVVQYLAPNANGNPATWFAGCIAFPDADLDTTFATPSGVFTVRVDDAQRGVPDSVAFTISRGQPGHPSVMVYETSVDQVTVISSEKRINPRYPDAGPFTWEKRTITRTTTYVPRVLGVGFSWAVPITAHSDVSVQWSTGDGTGTSPGRDHDDPPRRQLHTDAGHGGADRLQRSGGWSRRGDADRHRRGPELLREHRCARIVHRRLRGDQSGRRLGKRLPGVPAAPRSRPARTQTDPRTRPIVPGPVFEELEQWRRINTELTALVLRQAELLDPALPTPQGRLRSSAPG